MEGTYQWMLVCFICVNTLPALLSEKCLSKSQKTHLYLATKSPYRYLINKNDSSVHYPGCNVLRMWMIVRHGTRYPGSKIIRKMRERLPVLRDSVIQNHKLKRGRLCNEEIAALQTWSSHVEETDEKRLAHEGEDEMVELAERFQNRFPQILPDVYTNSTFKFQFTATQRTTESARHFTVGLFGRRVSRHVWFPEAIYRDPVLRFYKLCQRWRVEVDKNPYSLLERTKFEEGPEMSAALKDVSFHLGFNETMNIGDAILLYITCSFETAWDHRAQSPWCAAFSESNMKVFEYAEDLEHYWIDGYGYNITYKQACPPVKDMMQHFLAEEIPGDEPKAQAVVYFAHSGTLLKMLAHLGLYKDENALLHSNFNTVGKYRKWRVSQIDSFGANLAFILFRYKRWGRTESLSHAPHGCICT
ncbi:multiple inositol polyphosphate phosphatase 1-like isoform X2 [Zootermopsis nevadensis]|uniref:multiple inositol polyphosphate phosphatase 1-like isoform X2 n=1 Tax=Zootermopsis nevadensis TaxID=136037 RepID=UPI000B8EE85A|nr:multiple inositol polyphosphate phosphatase 1-like isoform X2 [Zootermopsis nevadensis]